MSINLDTETATPGLVCVECGHAMDRSSGPGQPGPGDFALCIRCGSLNVFDNRMRFRRPTDEEMFAAAADAGVQRARRAILSVNRTMTEPTSDHGNTKA